MIHIKTIACNMLDENTYVVSDDTLQAVIIDCGAYFDSERQAIVTYIHNNRLQPVHVLCTHGHLDHCCGNDTLYQAFHLQPELHAADQSLSSDMALQARSLFGMSYSHSTPPLGSFLAHGDTVTFGTHRLQVFHTPGHTPGGLVFYCADEDVAFTGDTLFRLSIGRTDFPGGSWDAMVQSLHNLKQWLPPHTTLYPGHGPTTTIEEEIKYNPYLR